MQYIVMECHTSYAIVLDETGKFLKAANMHYEVGQTVTEIVQMQEPETQSKPKKNLKWVYSLATIAACLVLAFTSFFTIRQIPYASVYMTINPEVRIDINRKDIVIGLEGMNEDGMQLVADYSYKEKNLNFVMDELVDRAIEMGYLSSGGQITLKLDAEDDEWVVVTGNTLGNHLNEYLTEKVPVTIQVNETITTGQEIVIPTNPDINTPETSTESSDYGVSDYGDTDDDGASDYSDGDSNYSDPAPPVSNEPDDSGSSDYDDSDSSDYEGSDYDDD